jgi:hypothetical protein
MDTDDLSEETYEAVLMQAERFSHDLTLHFGLLAKESKNEEEYIENAENLISEMQKLDSEELIDWFWGKKPHKEKLNKALLKIIENLEKVKKIPPDKRTYSF